MFLSLSARLSAQLLLFFYTKRFEVFPLFALVVIYYAVLGPFDRAQSINRRCPVRALPLIVIQ